MRGRALLLLGPLAEGEGATRQVSAAGRATRLAGRWGGAR